MGVLPYRSFIPFLYIECNISKRTESYWQMIEFNPQTEPPIKLPQMNAWFPEGNCSHNLLMTNTTINRSLTTCDVIKWKQFPLYWPFVRGIHRCPVNSPHKGQWRGALMFSLICVWINGWVNNRETGDLRRYHAHYDVFGMIYNGSHELPFLHVYDVNNWNM